MTRDDTGRLVSATRKELLEEYRRLDKCVDIGVFMSYETFVNELIKKGVEVSE